MKFMIPKGSPMMVSTADKKLQHHVSKHDQYFCSSNEFTLRNIVEIENGTTDHEFVFLDGRLRKASQLMKARFRMFVTANEKFPYIFVIPENIQIVGTELPTKKVK